MLSTIISHQEEPQVCVVLYSIDLFDNLIAVCGDHNSVRLEVFVKRTRYSA